MHTRSTFTRPIIAAIALAGALDFGANWLAAHVMVPLPFGLLAPGGTFLFSAAFVSYDYIRRQGGVAPTLTAVSAGFGLSMIYTFAFGGSVGRIALAGLAALAVSSTADLLAQGATLRWPVPHYVMASNASSLAIDTVLFVTIAFASLPPEIRIHLMEGQYVAKILMTLLAIPLVMYARRLGERRSVLRRLQVLAPQEVAS